MGIPDPAQVGTPTPYASMPYCKAACAHRRRCANAAQRGDDLGRGHHAAALAARVALDDLLEPKYGTNKTWQKVIA